VQNVLGFDHENIVACLFHDLDNRRPERLEHIKDEDRITRLDPILTGIDYGR
jgi:hypothetical protein